jgi:hypothetical protein
MNRPFLLFAVFMVIASGLYAQNLVIVSEPSSHTNQEENRITAISVSGLKRTKPFIVENALRKFLGREAGSIDANDVFAAIKSTGILEPLNVEIADNRNGSGKMLVVAVKEKWSIFPMPIVSISSSGWSAGGVFLDANAFGVKNVMMVMGLFGPGDMTAGAMYIHSPKGVGKFGVNVVGFFSLQENEDTDQTGEHILRRYDSMAIRPVIGLSYSLTEHITPSLNLAYRHISLLEEEGKINAPEDGVRGITLSPNIRVDFNSTWDGYFLNEKNISLKYEYTFVIGDSDVHSAVLQAGFNHSIIPGFRLTGKSGVVFSSPSAAPFFAAPPVGGVANILSGDYSPTDFAGVSLGLEKYLFKFSQGTLSLSAAYQAIYSHGDLLAHQFDHGPAAMLLLYFSQLALPAVGLGGAYNAAKNAWQYAFNVGMAF